MQTYVSKFKFFKSIIRSQPLEKITKINECGGMFIPDSRVLALKIVWGFLRKMNFFEVFTSDIILAHVVSKVISPSSDKKAKIWVKHSHRFINTKSKNKVVCLHPALNVFSRFSTKKYFDL